MCAMLAAAVTVSFVGCRRERIPGVLEYVTVDEVIVDITDGDEALEAALGERFAVLEDWEVPEGKDAEKIVFSHSYTLNSEDRRVLEFDTENPVTGVQSENVLLYKDIPANMTLEEICDAYQGEYFISQYGETMFTEVSVWQADGVIVDPAAAWESAAKLGYSAEKHTDEYDLYHYLTGMLDDGKIYELIRLHATFLDEECVMCTLECITAK